MFKFLALAPFRGLEMFSSRRKLPLHLRCKIRTFAFITFAVLGNQTLCVQSLYAESNDLPNIVLILADDLGYGDVACYNDKSKVPTPNIDELARQGMRFTDAHSPSTVCTPTRYSILTGRMAFRTGFKSVFVGVGGPCLIEEDRLTLGGMLQNEGYATAMFGKWHIGLSFQNNNGSRVTERGNDGVKAVDYSRSIPDAPIHRGFDQFYGTACCPTTDWLYAYIDGDQIPVPPVLDQPRDRTKLPTHNYSDDNRGGMVAPNFDFEEVDLVFLEKSQQFLQQHSKNNPDQPFFLFHSMQAIHQPCFPAKRFHGKTDAGRRGDFIHETDWIVGELVKTLEELKLTDNTIVIFCSDNGPEIGPAIKMIEEFGHNSSRPWRGFKRDQWEAGHRTPFIVKWPATIKAGSNSDQTISLTDLMATIASIVKVDLPNDAAEDSFDILPIWNGTQGDNPLRPYTLQQTISLALSVRKGNWKYLDHKGSGGNRYKPGTPAAKFMIADNASNVSGQLYDLSNDPGETNNLADKRTDMVDELKAIIEESKSSGRSAPLRKSD